MVRRYGVVIGTLTLLWIVPGLAAPVGQGLISNHQPIIGQAGAYAIQTAAEVSAMAASGFHLVVHSYVEPDSEIAVAMRAADVVYIDNFPEASIYRACGKELRATGYCSQSFQAAVITAIRTHLAKAAGDKQIAGYWVLDDYPGGDIRDLLKKVHNEIATANERAKTDRPALCGFGGVLDDKPRVMPKSVQRNEDRFAQVATNFDPQACDMVAVYLYGARADRDGTMIDWSMMSSLPAMLDALRARGWSQKSTPFIGMPHAFFYLGSSPQAHYALPRAEDVTAQTLAFCRAGAVALLAYTWDDSYKGEKIELFNSEALRSGFRLGYLECKQLWSHKP